MLRKTPRCVRMRDHTSLRACCPADATITVLYRPFGTVRARVSIKGNRRPSITVQLWLGAAPSRARPACRETSFFVLRPHSLALSIDSVQRILACLKLPHPHWSRRSPATLSLCSHGLLLDTIIRQLSADSELACASAVKLLHLCHSLNYVSLRLR